MSKYKRRNLYRLVGIVLVLLAIVIACEREYRDRHPAEPAGSQQGLSLKITGSFDDKDEPFKIQPIVEIQLKCPCWYRVEVEVKLSRGGTLLWKKVINAGDEKERALVISFDPYEEIRARDPIRITSKNGSVVQEGEKVELDEELIVSCGNVPDVGLFEAPDIDRFPLFIDLWEDVDNTISNKQSEKFYSTKDARVLEL